jgi:hypothetical protein
MKKWKDQPDPVEWKKWNSKYPQHKFIYDPNDKKYDKNGALYHILKQTDRATATQVFDDIDAESSNP